MQIVDQIDKNDIIGEANFAKSSLRSVKQTDVPLLLNALKNSIHIQNFLPTAVQMTSQDILKSYIREHKSLVWDTGSGIATWLILHPKDEEVWLEFMTFTEFLGRGYMKLSLQELLLNTDTRILAEADTENVISTHLLTCLGQKISTRVGPGYYQGKVSTRTYEIFCLPRL